MRYSIQVTSRTPHKSAGVPPIVEETTTCVMAAKVVATDIEKAASSRTRSPESSLAVLRIHIGKAMSDVSDINVARSTKMTSVNHTHRKKRVWDHTKNLGYRYSFWLIPRHKLPLWARYLGSPDCLNYKKSKLKHKTPSNRYETCQNSEIHLKQSSYLTVFCVFANLEQIGWLWIG